jgi:carbon-monoxide dehydrogenase medium subunit
MNTAGSDLPPFTYHRATGVEDALAHLRRDGSYPYAGGTDLLVALRHRAEWVADVRHLVDIKGVTPAQGITRSGDSIRIGALTTASALASSAVIRRHAKVLAMAAAQTSAPALRNRGTIGGNVMTPHPAGDVVTALLALGATAELAGRDELVPVAALVSGAFALPKGTFLTALNVPVTSRSWYERLAPRLAFSRATRSAAVVFRSEGIVAAAGGVAQRPMVLPADAVPDDELLKGMLARATHRATDRTPA